MDTISIKTLYEKNRKLESTVKEQNQMIAEQEFKIQIMEKHINYLFNNLSNCLVAIATLESNLALISSVIEDSNDSSYQS